MEDTFDLKRVSVMVPQKEHDMLVQYQLKKKLKSRDAAVTCMIREVCGDA